MGAETGEGQVKPGDCEAVDAVMADWRQGDVATNMKTTWYANRKRPLTEPSVGDVDKAASDLFAVDKSYAQVAVVTQTCEVTPSTPPGDDGGISAGCDRSASPSGP